MKAPIHSPSSEQEVDQPFVIDKSIDNVVF